MSRRRWALWGMAAGLAVPVSAEFSPLSIHEQGFGLPLAQMEARERGMGEAGMAAVASKGYFLPNVSRAAYFERTSFTATLESDMSWLRDNTSSNHVLTTAMPSLATFVKTKKLGAFGLYYQQTHQRHFGAAVSGSGIRQEFDAEGGLYLLGLAWAYSPLPLFSLGISGNALLGHYRLIDIAEFQNLPNGENLRGDTLEMNHADFYPVFSGTVRLSGLDLALSFKPETRLNTERARRVTGLLADPVADTSRVLPWTVAAGVGWRVSGRQFAAFDAYFENWEGGGGLLNPAYKLAAGYEFRGGENPFENYRRRVSYRGGAGYQLLYLRKTPELYATLGLGLPLGPRGHVLDISLKYGHRSFDGNTFFAEDYVKVSASVIGVGIWGQPVRKRR